MTNGRSGEVTDHFHNPLIFVMGCSLLILVFLLSILYITRRKMWKNHRAFLETEIYKLQAKLDRAHLFLSTDPYIVLTWNTRSGDPEMEGDPHMIFGEAKDITTKQILNYSLWLRPDCADVLEDHIERLRHRGEAFELVVPTLLGSFVEIQGNAVGGRAVVRLRDVSGDRLALYELHHDYETLKEEETSLKLLLNHLHDPCWIRKKEGALKWVNAAYIGAVEAKNGEEVIEQQLEFMDASLRSAALDAHQQYPLWEMYAPAVVAGERHPMRIISAHARTFEAGIAFDLSELEKTRAELGYQMKAHAQTLDQLATSVAIFDRTKRLLFYNASYRSLWNLDPAFLDQNPTDSEILDRLRTQHLLPEQADYRTWKSEWLTAYMQNETSQHIWYVPDGRTLRVVVNPNPQGGVTYLFDDVTERVDLESRYNALMRVQGETLDTLREGVAVFGTDGRLKLFNSAFTALWKLEPLALRDRQPHVDEILHLCTPFEPSAEELHQWTQRLVHPTPADTHPPPSPYIAGWGEIRSHIVGLHDKRLITTNRMIRKDGSVIDCTSAPLPDGAALLTFTDVTASVNVERALLDRNQALMEAEKLRNEFVHHVSYELRSPLTNIIGFIQLLGDPTVGHLNEKQHEYVGYVMDSSKSLLAIINDILDLASIDAGAMELKYEDVDITSTIQAASRGLQDRLTESNIRLNIVVDEDIGTFRADGKRVRQILFNLLSNAIGFSSPGQTVTLTALREREDILFKVVDQGRGIPADILDQVFDRFHSRTAGTRHRGVGLGLSIVRSFIELHGGTVSIDTLPGEGTVVTCVFPANGYPDSQKTKEVAA